MTSTLPDFDRLLALCEAAPQECYSSSLPAVQFYWAAYEALPDLIAHYKSEKARADEAERGIELMMDVAEPHWRGAGVKPSAEWAIREFMNGYNQNQSEREAAEAELAKLREARGEVTEAAVDAACEAFDKEAVEWPRISKVNNRITMRAALTAALPHFVPDRGEMPEAIKALCDGYLAKVYGTILRVENPNYQPDNGSDPYLVCDLRALAKQQDASRDVRLVEGDECLVSDFLHDRLRQVEDERDDLKKKAVALLNHINRIKYRDTAGLRLSGENEPRVHDLAVAIYGVYEVERALIDKPAPQQDAGGESKAARDVLAERRRQVESEGWSTEHDDRHDMSEMSSAAACYALIHPRGGSWRLGFVLDRLWPWDHEWWKPRSQRENLVRAGALIIAEIERLDRLPPPPAQEPRR